MTKTSASADRPLVARWETRGNDWLELTGWTGHPGCYWYSGNGCGGGFDAANDEAAIAVMQGKNGQATVLKLDRPSLRRVR
jgi:hypothetical protein